MPLHVWLPEAHPAAPSHVSAVMSGVMIKTGIYGLLRALTLLGAPPAWWGWLLVGIGLTSGVLGVLFALAQHDLKRLLAYHSVENIGIIALGLGVGLLGVSAATPALAVLGFAGALLHVVNHAVFKGLLFLGAGAVQHATGTREIDHLGGLLKRMPWTGATFLVGAAAISGLPPLNGFVSEFLIYLGAFHGGAALSGANAVASLFVILALALIGGLALACFAKAFGIIFLGEPRSEHAAPRARGRAGDAAADAAPGRRLPGDRPLRAASRPGDGAGRRLHRADAAGRDGPSVERDRPAAVGHRPLRGRIPLPGGAARLDSAAGSRAATLRRGRARGTAATRGRRRGCSTPPRRSPSR